MPKNDRDLHPAGEGRGALLQRDYWAVLERPRMGPREVARVIAERFADFAPPDLVRFARPDGSVRPLDAGDELDVRIRMAGRCRVIVVHRDELSFTLCTVRGHPEAGRITFGVYPNPEGELVFHIRSRTRAATLITEVGFLTMGEPMQASTWSGFIDRVAAVVAEGVRDVIHVETREVEETEADRRADCVEPTFRAVLP